MTPQEIKAALVDRSVLALTMFGEGRGDWRQGNSSVEERIAIGCVARNRLTAYRYFRAQEPTYRSVCLAPAQFSCWSPIGGPANYTVVMGLAEAVVMGVPITDALFKESLFLADGIMAGLILDRTGGSTQYWAPKAMKPTGAVPSWAKDQPTLAIGDQLFLKA